MRKTNCFRRSFRRWRLLHGQSTIGHVVLHEPRADLLSLVRAIFKNDQSLADGLLAEAKLPQARHHLVIGRGHLERRRLKAALVAVLPAVLAFQGEIRD